MASRIDSYQLEHAMRVDAATTACTRTNATVAEALATGANTSQSHNRGDARGLSGQRNES
eukprot:5555575-Pleurochrysis_carterae.AAC.1